MASLILKRFQCVEDTNEMGGESPYFITWVGDIVTRASALRLTRKTYWNNNVSKGPGAWPVDDTVASGFSLTPLRTLALAIMVEKDEGIDVVSAEVTSMRDKMQGLLNTWGPLTVDSNDANFVSTSKNTFEQMVRQALGSAAGADDDLMEEDNWRAARRITLSSSPGELPIVTFKGGDGQYNVRYGIV